MAEHKDVLNVARLGRGKILREPLGWRMTILPHRIGIDDDKVRSPEVETVGKLTLVRRKLIDSAIIARDNVEGHLTKQRLESPGVKDQIAHVGTPGFLVVSFSVFPILTALHTDARIALGLMIARHRDDVCSPF